MLLLLPLITVAAEALRKGWETYLTAVTDKYTVRAVLLTLEATVCAVAVNTIFGLFAAWAVTKFRFRGKKLLTTLIDVPVTVSPVIAGLIYILTFGRQSILYPLLQSMHFKIVFAVPGIILATIFVTFPFISRELIPVLEAQGTDEEEAAALMGAKGLTIFRRVTFPHIRWHSFTALCSVRQEPWVSSARFLFCPAICAAEPIRCLCTWKSCLTNFSMFRRLPFLPFWF